MSRFRRLRKTANIRDLIRETYLHKNDFIQPYFVIEGKNKKQLINAMPGVERLSIDLLLKDIERFVKVGGKAILLFGLPAKKDAQATSAIDVDGLIPRAVRSVKQKFPQLVVMTDVCLCAYTDHGHCGIVHGREINNDKTIDLLAKMAFAHAQAGVDIVAPSDMMDLRVAAIRRYLDNHQYNDVSIMSYAVKYASAFYGPFREAADSTPQFGDRKSYQMDFANTRESLKEARQDVSEGADIIMVKPAVVYTDIIAALRRDLTVPIAAYHVSGEYSMIKAAAAKGWIDEKKVVFETLTGIKRAGADLIITYYAKDVLGWI